MRATWAPRPRSRESRTRPIPTSSIGSRSCSPTAFPASSRSSGPPGPRRGPRRGVGHLSCAGVSEMESSGWSGLGAGIVKRGVEAVEARAAAIGPGIGPCCYEVGDEVLGAFEPLGPDLAEDRMLDLRLVARRLLQRAGVESIEVSEACTSCQPELFFSHRRDGERTGRQAGLVWLAQPQPAASESGMDAK